MRRGALRIARCAIVLGVAAAFCLTASHAFAACVGAPVATASTDTVLRLKGAAELSTAQSIGDVSSANEGDLAYDAANHLISFCNGTNWIDLTNGIGGSGTTNYVARWTPNGTTLGTGILYDNGTNVGIGMTNPSHTLDVNGTLNATGNISTSGNVYTGGGGELQTNGDVYMPWAGEWLSTALSQRVSSCRICNYGCTGGNYCNCTNYGCTCCSYGWACSGYSNGNSWQQTGVAGGGATVAIQCQ